jgi:hypothetical protein
MYDRVGEFAALESRVGAIANLYARWRARRGTLCHRGGGQTLFDRQSPKMPKDESEIGEKLPELFDIHVMFFADTSNEAITALQHAFSLERSVAEKLVADVPVMVKRAASPEVADSLLDVLNNLGAQVVLLPSTSTPSVVPDDAAGSLLSGGAPIWGGLDLKAPSQSESRARLPNAQVVSLGRIDAEPLRERVLQSDPPLPKPAVVVATSVAPGPSHFPRVETPIPAPVAVAAQVLDADEPDRFALDPAAAPLELQHLEPTPRVYPAQLRSRSSRAPAAADQEQDLELDLEQNSEPPSAGRPRGARESDVDLGLGSVPPLPSASAARPPMPRVPPAKPVVPARPPARPAVDATTRAPRSGPQASESADQSAVLPDLQLALPNSGDAFWSAKRKTPGQGRDGGEPTSARGASTAKQAATRSQPPRSSMPAEAPRSRTFALAALLGGVLLFAVSAYFDQSIFSGSASPFWIVVQGLGFLGVGTGCTRIRR